MEKLAKRSDARIGLTPNAKRKAVSNFLLGMLYLGPMLFLMIVFIFYPILKTLYYSFYSTNPRGVPVLFVGLDNYINLVTSDSFLTSMKATFLYVLYTVPIGVALALFLAVIASEKLRGIEFFRVIFSSTVGISVAAGSTIWLFIFHPSIGLLNRVLGYAGISPIAWLTDSDWALISVSITSIWMGIGFNFIILLGGLQSIPEDIYESATIDGAGYWTKLFRITLPMVSPSLFFVIIVTVIHSFQSFGQIDILTQGGPAESTNLIVYSIFQNAFIHYKFGVASAQAIILFIVVLIVTVIQFKVGEKKVHYQ
ncbi:MULTISPECIES: carbohydrate ABC transporter permease [Paenibacillus]|uniref:Glycerol-3-phosphate ABC transporter permease n=1 Tax=Paenibacillus naphthalenovorans TaxID=162209 RepID=A0A0U2VX94_9BACL|nr:MULTISPECIES: sugar ABC transporter permease [Paenibacillus]ALS24103.1 glycerol-3-phosphate ABC transporter permease [Paenibacillus naphthalenovorans]GCL72321.1 sugar ABC transporter permease [Paenibacillus naphthalenovorans]SDJ20764.1 multiple sugar transport system permease protein/sn-glycerol 3-phosphate transport system permease protein [Paenibacillus naphthalenovorans]